MTLSFIPGTTLTGTDSLQLLAVGLAFMVLSLPIIFVSLKYVKEMRQDTKLHKEDTA